MPCIIVRNPMDKTVDTVEVKSNVKDRTANKYQMNDLSGTLTHYNPETHRNEAAPNQ